MAAGCGARAIRRRAPSDRRRHCDAGGVGRRRGTGGRPVEAPPAPTYPDGWQLGTPDLILRAAEPFVVPAEGGDVFWNFVLPSTATRHALRARDGDPAGQRALVHHANVLLDTSGAGRVLDAQSSGPGLRGHGRDARVGSLRAGQPLPVLEAGHASARRASDTPGDRSRHRPRSEPAPAAFGQAESIRPAIGLYFTRHRRHACPC